MSKRKPPSKKKAIARRDPPRRPLSNPTASVTPLSARRVTAEPLRLDPALFADTFLPNNEADRLEGAVGALHPTPTINVTSVDGALVPAVFEARTRT